MACLVRNVRRAGDNGEEQLAKDSRVGLWEVHGNTHPVARDYIHAELVNAKHVDGFRLFCDHARVRSTAPLEFIAIVIGILKQVLESLYQLLY